MKLGMIGFPDEQSFRLAGDKGLGFLEFCVNSEEDLLTFYEQVDELEEWKDIYGIAVQSIGRWGTNKLHSDGEIIEEELDHSFRLIDAAHRLGCEHFVCGVNYVENISYFDNCKAAIRFLAKLIHYAREKKVKISTYNCRWNNFIVDDGSWKIIHGHLDMLGIKYDPSHARYAGGNYLKEMRDWGGRFNHVHIKGSVIIDGKRFDDPPAGLDQTDWASFLAILYAKKYAGGLSIEPHSANWQGELGEQGLDYTIDYMKKHMV